MTEPAAPAGEKVGLWAEHAGRAMPLGEAYVTEADDFGPLIELLRRVADTLEFGDMVARY
jgi:hypothetical protein